MGAPYRVAAAGWGEVVAGRRAAMSFASMGGPRDEGRTLARVGYEAVFGFGGM